MDTMIALAGIMFVASITPGPNNFIILIDAASNGYKSSLPLMIGVIAGSIALLFLIWSGLGLLLEEAPQLALLLKVAGTAYLAWMGGMMMLKASATEIEAKPSRYSGAIEKTLGMFGFQFLNPKSWAFMTTMVTVANGASEIPIPFYYLTSLFIVIPFPCLSIWATMGTLISTGLKNQNFSLWFNRIMGGLLVLCAVLLLLG